MGMATRDDRAPPRTLSASCFEAHAGPKGYNIERVKQSKYDAFQERVQERGG